VGDLRDERRNDAEAKRAKNGRVNWGGGEEREKKEGFSDGDGPSSRRGAVWKVSELVGGRWYFKERSLLPSNRGILQRGGGARRRENGAREKILEKKRKVGAVSDMTRRGKGSKSSDSKSEDEDLWKVRGKSRCWVEKEEGPASCTGFPEEEGFPQVVKRTGERGDAGSEPIW